MDERTRRASRPLPVAETFDGAHVLITGVTGFLGKVWLAFALERLPRIGRISVLVRGQRGRSAVRRLVEVLGRSPALRPCRARWGSRLLDEVGRRLHVLDGDVGQPLCGLDRFAARAAMRDVDLVLHFAGLTDFEPDPRLGLETNVLGALHVADLASLARRPRLLHVSTAFVAGCADGRVPERLEVGRAPSGAQFDPRSELEALRALCRQIEGVRDRIAAANARAAALGWPNLYTYTKGLAEHLLATSGSIPLAIVRPAVVESAWRFPFTGWNEGINTSGPLVWLLSTWFRGLPSVPAHRFDVVPVDAVAAACTLVAAALLRDEPEATGVFHVGTSDRNPLTFGRAIDLTALAVRRMHGRADADPIDRWLVRFLDAVPRPADREPPLSLAAMRRLARAVRDATRPSGLRRWLPPALDGRLGTTIEAHARRLSNRARAIDRTLGRVEELLRLYRPFIHDHDWVFETDRWRALEARLDGEERPTFGSDLERLDWRRYWLEVHVPGLERWCLPLLRGERIPQDEPPWTAETERAVVERLDAPRARAAEGNARGESSRIEVEEASA
ncbi:MAG: SDR family oxidoreductase [Myxococcota bacterium]|nr:SDR family oxidoreductase [Myxococcota bacterium]MDW8363921.1 SDR family oxidoreductase [Myxococcales bacterium]